MRMVHDINDLALIQNLASIVELSHHTPILYLRQYGILQWLKHISKTQKIFLFLDKLLTFSFWAVTFSIVI